MLWLIAIFTYFTAASHLAQKYKKKNVAEERPKSQVCVCPSKRFPFFPSAGRRKSYARPLWGECGRGMRPSAGVEFIPCVQLNAPLH